MPGQMNRPEPDGEVPPAAWGSPEGRAARGRQSVGLAVASVVNGLTAYAIAAIGAHHFGAASFAPYANLWTILTLALAAVTFPIQHWVIRVVTIEGGEGAVGGALKKIVASVAVVAVGIFVVSLWLAGQWFDGSALFAAFSGILVVESGIIGLSRGLLVARGTIGRAAIVMGGENLIRLSAGLVVIAVGAGVTAYGASILTGVLIVALFPDSVRVGTDPVRTTRSVVGVLGGIAGGTLLSQVVLVSSPLVVSILTDERDVVTAMFANTALARAPFLVALGIGLQATAILSHMYASDPGKLSRWGTAGSVLGGAAAIGGGVVFAVAAPRLVPLMFGNGTDVSTTTSFLIGTASSLAVVGLFMSLVLVVMDRAAVITAAWLVGVLASVVVILLVPLDAVPLTATAFAAAEVVAVVGLSVPPVLEVVRRRQSSRRLTGR